jgi:voltage-dependent calcium channel T type alpha-1G
MCKELVERKWFDNVILLFIALNCITLAMERPNIPPHSTERMFLSTANYIFTVVFAVEMFVKVAYQYTNLISKYSVLYFFGENEEGYGI